MFTQVYAELCRPFVDFLAIDCSRERFILQLLLDRPRFKVPDAVWSHQRTGDHKPGQFVAGIKPSREQSIPRHPGVICMTKYGPANVLAVAVLAQYFRTLQRMIGGIRIHFVVEVVQQAGDCPCFFVRLQPASISLHYCFYRERVLSQRVAFGVLAEQNPCIFSRRHEANKIER